MHSSRQGCVNPAENRQYTRMLLGSEATCYRGEVRKAVDEMKNAQAKATPGHPFPVAIVIIVGAASARPET
jgi:hypothetical protein